MSFVVTADIAAHLGITDSGLEPHLTLAEEAIIPAMLRTTRLEEWTVTEVQRLVRPRQSIELRQGPVADHGQITSVTVSGESAMTLSDVIYDSPWSISRHAWFPGGVDITIVYKAGFTGANLPGLVRQSIILAAAYSYQHPDASLMSEKIGDYQYSRGEMGAGEEDPAMRRIRSWLSRWARPRL